MLAFRGSCLRLARPSSILLSSLPHNTQRILPTTNQSIRNRQTTMRKKKKKSHEFVEKPAAKRLRLKLKRLKEQDIKRKKIEKQLAAARARFRLPAYIPRPDAVPLATAMRLLRTMHAKQEIFVRSRAARWLGETRVMAAVKVVPNSNTPRGFKGKLELPHKVAVGAVKEGGKKKKERVAIIVDGEEEGEKAREAGMIYGGKEYLEKIAGLVEKGEALPFDILLATPSTATWFRPYGRVLGPKGLVPSERRGTVVQDFSTYTTREEKGTDIKLDGEGKGKNGAMARVVVGKFKQNDRQIYDNVTALCKFVKESTGNTRLPLEVFLYTTIHRSLTLQHPYLNLFQRIHIPRITASGRPTFQRPTSIYPSDAPYFLSNSTPHIPVSDIAGVGYNKRPVIRIFRYLAGADWKRNAPLWSQLARFKTGIRDLEQKKAVWLWHKGRTEETVRKEREMGWRRAGDGFVPRRLNVVEKVELEEKLRREERARKEQEKMEKGRVPPGTKPQKPRKLKKLRKLALHR